jgi:transcriptional regulator with XRE-family HTH domain
MCRILLTALHPLQHLLRMVHTLRMSLVLIDLNEPDRLGTLGGRIQTARFVLNWDQAALEAAMKRCAAEHPDLDVKAPSRRTISAWENEHTSPTVKQLILVALATGRSAEWFVTGLDGTGPTADGDGPGPGTPPGTRTQNLRIHSTPRLRAVEVPDTLAA